MCTQLTVGHRIPTVEFESAFPQNRQRRTCHKDNDQDQARTKPDNPNSSEIGPGMVAANAADRSKVERT